MIILNIEYMNKRKKELGLTVKELSEIAKVPLGTVSKIMAGLIKNPKLETLQKLAFALKCTLDDFSITDKLHSEEKNIDKLELTADEIEIIKAYRSAPQMQEAVKKLLGIE